MSDLDAEALQMMERAIATEQRALDIVLPHVGSYAPFDDMPESVQQRRIADFVRIAGSKAVSRDEAMQMAGTDLQDYIRRFHVRLLTNPQLNASRLAVLAHVSMVIGFDTVNDCKPLWDAIHRKAWEDAADVLLMTNWPERAVTEKDRRRVLELARMMRNGMPPLSLTLPAERLQ